MNSKRIKHIIAYCLVGVAILFSLGCATLTAYDLLRYGDYYPDKQCIKETAIVNPETNRLEPAVLIGSTKGAIIDVVYGESCDSYHERAVKSRLYQNHNVIYGFGLVILIILLMLVVFGGFAFFCYLADEILNDVVDWINEDT